MKKIYSEIKDLEFKNTVIRTFASEVDQRDLIWTKSDENIIIEPLHSSDWNVQFEKMFPQRINEKTSIRKNERYRLLKGTGSLKLRVYIL